MTTNVFLDSNILLYAVSNAAAESALRLRARELIETNDWGVSVQVLQEFYVNATGKLAKTLPQKETLLFIERIMLCPVVPVTPALFLQAISIRIRFQLSYWDAAIVAAAQQLGCKVLYSEDLNDGQTFGDVQVINPFR